MQNYDYIIYTLLGFLLTCGALLSMVKTVIYQQSLISKLTSKLMAMSAQFPHTAYLEMQTKGLAVQAEQWRAASEQSRPAGVPENQGDPSAWTKWQQTEAGG